MKKLIILLPLYILFVNCSYAQISKLWLGYESGDKTSLGIAISIEEAVSLLEKVSELMIEEKEISFGLSHGFSSPDTILELVRIDYEGHYPYQDRYVVNLSKGLKISTYRELIHETQTKLKRGHYIYDNVCDRLVNAIGSWFGNSYTMFGKFPIGQEQESLEFYKEIILLRIINGNIMMFRINAKYINDAMRQAGIEQLKDPKWPHQYLDQYMGDKRDEWNPARIDTTGIPEEYFVHKYVKYGALPPGVDSLTKVYILRILNFNYYDKIAKDQGITPQEALYNEVKNRFYYQGYKEFHYMISYAIKHEDELLLNALREFVDNHPDYEVSDKMREFFEEAHQFVEDNR